MQRTFSLIHQGKDDRAVFKNKSTWCGGGGEVWRQIYLPTYKSSKGQEGAKISPDNTVNLKATWNLESSPSWPFGSFQSR